MGQVRIAVIGSGISGITAAWMLQPIHEVTLFEAADRMGGHTNTVRIDLPDETHEIDTGFIVHNRRNYPVFCRLLDRWGVATQPSEMSFSVAVESTGLEYAGTNLNGLFAQRGNITNSEFWSLMREVLRFGRLGRAELSATGVGPTLDEFLGRHGFSAAFSDNYLVPLGSAVWSADPNTFGRFPARSLLRFLDNQGLLTLVNRPPWRTITGGSKRYIEAAIASRPINVRTSTPVRSVRRDGEPGAELGVEIELDGASERFDAVIMAVHSDQALAMLGDASPAEKEVLGAVAYQRNIAVLHTDERMLPSSPRAWAAWNYHRPVVDAALPTVTYLMNRLHSIDSPHQICVTLNRESEIRPERVHATFEYHHPVYDHGAFAAQQRWNEVNGVRNTWFCGAWWGYGFHEDGAASGHRAAVALGATPA